MSNKIKSPQEFLIDVNLLHLISLTNIEDVIKQAQRQAIEETLEFAAKKAIYSKEFGYIISKNGILNLKNSEELRV